MLNSPHTPIPNQSCPAWAADFRALQTEHANLSTEAENQLTTTLSQPTTVKEKFQSLQQIVKKIDEFLKKLEDLEVKVESILLHGISPEHRELIKTDLLPKFEAWLKSSHLNEEPINPALNPNFKGFNLLQLDETTGRYYYVGGQTRESEEEKFMESPETIALYKKFAGRRFDAPNKVEFIARIKPKLDAISQMKKTHGEVGIVFALIGNSIRANADIYNAELDKLSLTGRSKLSPTFIDDDSLDRRELNEGVNKYFGEWEFNEVEDEMKMVNGKTKEELIEENKGFLMSIVPTKLDLPDNPDPDIVYGQTKAMTILQKDLEEVKAVGGRPRCPEEDLALRMQILTEGKIIDVNTFTSLLGVDTVEYYYFACGNWAINHVYLGHANTNYEGGLIRLRYSV